jgi:hypothetical protein
VTVSELIAELRGCEPDAVIVGTTDAGAGLLDTIRTGWYAPELVVDGSNDFWADGAHCTSWDDGVYHPRPKDQRAVHLSPSED